MADAATLTFGNPLYRYDVVGSTQDVAREWVVRGAPPGMVVMARAMTAGRGRRGRVWHVPPGANVCLTAVGPAVVPEALWQVALVAGLAVVHAVEAVAPSVPARLRFPNDVYVRERKLSGVLVEAVPARGGDGLIPLVGVGVNVRAAPLPDDVAGRAISLAEAGGAEVTVEEVQSALLSALSAIWNRWQASGLPAILADWRGRTDGDAWRTFLFDGLPTLCRVRDIASDGTVLLELEGGRGERFRLRTSFWVTIDMVEQGGRIVTLALCFGCGGTKFGALVPCMECQAPSTGNVELDILFSDHYMHPDTLQEFGQVIRTISPLSTDPHDRFLAFMHSR